MNITAKANLVLNVILATFLLIVLRIWHLSVIQHEAKLEESQKPQRKVVIEASPRASIRDRFNIPLAVNKVQYNLAIIYSQFMQIPRIVTEKDSTGRLIKKFKRKEHIQQLSELLAKELGMDAERIEDLIYSKASYYYQIPLVIKEDLSEKEYYRLHMLENDWPGIHVEKVPKRSYPQGKVAAHIVGYMGAINKEEYDRILREINHLQKFVYEHESGEMAILPEGFFHENDVYERLNELKERAYTIHDQVGKTGIEALFDESLKGFQGRKNFFSDARGNYLKELSGEKKPVPGERLLLSISAELQEYAEKLLVLNEKVRKTRLTKVEEVKRSMMALKEPWIKGGAIVVMDPKNGEVLALATTPRFDSNDFISKNKSTLCCWLENEHFLAEVWDQKRSLQREIYDPENDRISDEYFPLTLDVYLQFILPKDSPVKKALESIGTVGNAIGLQRTFYELLTFSPRADPYPLLNFLYEGEQKKPYGDHLTIYEKAVLKGFSSELLSYKKKLDKYFHTLNNPYDQVLLVDLTRVLVAEDLFTEDLLKHIDSQSLNSFKNVCGAIATVKDLVQGMAKELFHSLEFQPWRKEHGKEFLKQKRLDEKALHQRAKPYLDYFDAEEKSRFHIFWETHKWDLISAFLVGKCPHEENIEPYIYHFRTWYSEISQGAHPFVEWRFAYKMLQNALESLDVHLVQEFLKTLRSYNDLDKKLLGHYRNLRKDKEGVQLERHLASAFYPKTGYGIGRSQAYRQAASQGSIFKLITAYEAMIQKYNNEERAPKTISELNPLTITEDLHYRKNELYMGYDSNEIPIPRHYKGGRLPRSTSSHLGPLDLLKAIETSSNPYFAIVAGDCLKQPEDLAKAARKFGFGLRTGIDLPGEITGNIPSDLELNRTGLYSSAIGQHTLVVTPLQTSVMLSAIANGGKILKPKIVRMRVEQKQGCSLVPLPTEIRQVCFMPSLVRYILLEGMRRVVTRTHGDSLYSLSQLYHEYPEAISDYIDLKKQLIGKTSTAESVETIDLDLSEGTNLYTHVWFGGISFKNDLEKGETIHISHDLFDEPEIVVVVYLRYGAFGKEAAPIAAQIVKKWREIKANWEIDRKR